MIIGAPRSASGRIVFGETLPFISCGFMAAVRTARQRPEGQPTKRLRPAQSGSAHGEDPILPAVLKFIVYGNAPVMPTLLRSGADAGRGHRRRYAAPVRVVSDHLLRVQDEIDAVREMPVFAFEASSMLGRPQQAVITHRSRPGRDPCLRMRAEAMACQKLAFADRGAPLTDSEWGDAALASVQVWPPEPTDGRTSILWCWLPPG